MKPEAAQTPEQAPPTRRFRLVTRAAMRRLTILAAAVVAALLCAYFTLIRVPGESHRGPLPPLTPAQATLAAELRRDVEALAGGVGQRSIFYPARLAEAALHLQDQLRAAGYDVQEHSFVQRGTTCPNLQAVLPGATHPDQIIVVGAHYDAFQGTPGADDNASGAAAVLALARSMAGRPAARTIRFVLFVNEEPPSFQTEDMGSWVYAKACRAAGDDIRAMLSLETIGYYTDEPGSQQYPRGLDLLYPSQGNFIAFVGNYTHRALVRRSIGLFREHAAFPSEGAALFGGIPGVAWSDHWAFWKEGYPALMVTDTAPFRNPHYHQPTDTPDTLDYERMARVVEGLEQVVRALADEPGA